MSELKLHEVADSNDFSIKDSQAIHGNMWGSLGGLREVWG